MGVLFDFSMHVCVAYWCIQFDMDYLEFRSQFDALQAQIQAFIDMWFEKTLSVSCHHHINLNECTNILPHIHGRVNFWLMIL